MKRAIFFLLVNIFIETKTYSQTGTFTDPRNGKTYKTIEINTKTWMAENLAYADPSKNDTSLILKMSGIYGFCYNDSVVNCKKYGLLYNWEVAQKACPLGWYLPSKSDYDRLLSFVGNTKKERYEALIKGGSAGF